MNGLLAAYSIDRAIIPIVSRMIHNGMPVSVTALHALRPKFKSLQDQAFFTAAAIAGAPFNPGSSDQVATILHGQYGVPVKYKTATGKPSTKEAYLAVYAADYPKVEPLVKQVLEYRKYDQLISTFIDPIASRAVDGWIHYQLHLASTATSRLSSSDPNFQNIPTRDVEGQWIRDCFIAPPGWVFVSNDLCLAEGTLIDTPYGPKSIESLASGDVVFSYGEDRPSATTVKSLWYTGEQECFQVNMDNGRSFTATASHKMGVLLHTRENGKWVKVKVSDLKPGDRLLSLKRTVSCKVLSIVPVGKKRTWNMEVAAPTHVFALTCGVISSNSQIELRVAAHISQDPELLKAYRTPGTDLHSATAMAMFGRADGIWRYIAKTINFATLYGISAEGLYKGLVKEAPQTPWTIPQAQDYLDRYFASHPGVVRYIDTTQSFLRRHGYVMDLFGGRRSIPKVYSASPRIVADALREGINLPIQGTAARILKVQMAAVDRAMLDLGWYERDLVRPLLQIHDDLLFLVQEDVSDLAAGVIRGVMEDAYRMSVPILATTKVGTKWGNMKEQKEEDTL